MRETNGLSFKAIACRRGLQSTPRRPSWSRDRVFYLQEGAGRVNRLNASTRLEIRAVEVLVF